MKKTTASIPVVSVSKKDGCMTCHLNGTRTCNGNNCDFGHIRSTSQGSIIWEFLTKPLVHSTLAAHGYQLIFSVNHEQKKTSFERSFPFFHTFSTETLAPTPFISRLGLTAKPQSSRLSVLFRLIELFQGFIFFNILFTNKLGRYFSAYFGFGAQVCGGCLWFFLNTLACFSLTSNIYGKNGWQRGA